jgi:hypothetical protein
MNIRCKFCNGENYANQGTSFLNDFSEAGRFSKRSRSRILIDQIRMRWQSIHDWKHGPQIVPEYRETSRNET